MIRNLLVAGIATFAAAGAASAADMPSYPPEAPAFVEPPAPDWTGFYIGAHGGWNWGETDADGLDIGDMEGFVVGGQAGYNWQWDSFVLGLEADGSFVDTDDDDGFDADIEQNYLATFRGRLGFGFDRILLYGTGGAAFTGLDLDMVVGDDDDANYFGWVAGGGIEFMVTDNVTLGVEYLHYEFGDEDIGDDGFGDGFDIGLSNDVVRGRLNVKFDSLFGN